MFRCKNAPTLSLKLLMFHVEDGMELKSGNTQEKMWQDDFMEF